MTQAGTAAAIHLLRAGILTCQQSPALLQQPGAALSLAGAVTSIIKAWRLQCAELAADSTGIQGAEAVSASARPQLAVLPRVPPVVQMLAKLAELLPDAAAGASAPDDSGSNSSSRS
jgi:hypothetical protein